jgi:hypothetical protein
MMICRACTQRAPSKHIIKFHQLGNFLHAVHANKYFTHAQHAFKSQSMRLIFRFSLKQVSYTQTVKI